MFLNSVYRRVDKFNPDHDSLIVLYLDCTKAFDMVPLDKLISKLEKLFNRWKFAEIVVILLDWAKTICKGK